MASLDPGFLWDVLEMHDCYRIRVVILIIGPMAASEHVYYQIMRQTLIENKSVRFSFPPEKSVLRDKNLNI